MSLAKKQLNTIEILISNALIDKFVLVNIVLRKYKEMKEEINILYKRNGNILRQL